MPASGVQFKEEFVRHSRTQTFMKRILFLVLSVLSTVTIVAQTSPNPSSDSVISAPRPSPAKESDLGAANLTFTNQSGGTFSVADLESQLRKLQASVEQTLPMVVAYNSSFGSGTGAAEAIGGVLSKVLSRGEKKADQESSNAPKQS